MFDFIRNHQRWMQFILLVLIVPSFAFVGIQGFSGFLSREADLATVGKQAVTQQEFDLARRNQLEQYRSLLGAQFDPAAIDTPAMREQLLNQLIDRRVVALAAADGRLSVSDETLRRTIAGIPAFQADGRFSPEKYREMLAAQNMTPPGFEASLRRDLATSRVLQPVGRSAQVPKEVATAILAALGEKRTVRTRTFAAADYRSQVQVSDADIQSWYDDNKQSLEIPEQVQAEYLVLDEAAASRGIEVQDSEIASYYEQNKARYGQPERRRASHILITVPAGADAQAREAARAKAEDLARQAAANPPGFAELAKAQSQDPGSAPNGGDLGWISPKMLVAPVEQAVFDLQKGQVSGVVESNFGYHVIMVTDIQPAAVKPLDEVREDIRNEIRKQMATERYAEMATKLTDLVYDQRDSLQPAADALGLKLRKAAGITRDGLLDAERAGPGSAAASPDAEMLRDPRVRQALFSAEVLREKQNSGVIELTPGTMMALRVAALQPAHVPPLDQVRDRLREQLIDERAAQAARKAGSDMLESLRKSAAEPLPAGFGEPLTVTRQQPGDMSRAELDAIMRQPATTLPAYAGVERDQDYVIARIEKVEAAPAPEPQALQQLESQLASAWGQTEEEAVMQMLRQRYEVKVLPEAARAIRGEGEQQ